MKILLIASLMVMVSAPVMAGKFSFKSIKDIKNNKKEVNIKSIKATPKVETITHNEPGIVAIKPLKPILVKQTDFRAYEDATMRMPASVIKENAELIKLKRAAP